MAESAQATMQPATPEAKTETKPAYSDTEQVIFTMRADTGDVVKIERIDKTGSRGDLSEEECRRIAGEDGADEIDSALDAASEFEDAIVDAVGDDDFFERLILLRLLPRRIDRGVSAFRTTMLRRLVLRRLIRAAKLP